MSAEHEISYRADRRIDGVAFRDILERSGLAARRPADDLPRLERMLSAYNLVLTAWQDELLVGIATTWTDHAFSAYLADLAVAADFQKRGIGRRLIALTREAVGPQVTLMLLSAPQAAGYYPKIGMERFTDCFLIRRSE
jgi:ribosomal protein S18 acetylase RimI-like enzyme